MAYLYQKRVYLYHTASCQQGSTMSICKYQTKYNSIYWKILLQNTNINGEHTVRIKAGVCNPKEHNGEEDKMGCTMFSLF